MSVRARLFYEKRGGACFVPHIALATLFTRAANRAKIGLRSTDGFSPHAKMSFGPELPAGVVALCEPLDLWLAEEEGNDGIVSRLNEQMPKGFMVKGIVFPKTDAPSLGKDCKAGHYLVWSRTLTSSELTSHLDLHFKEALLFKTVNEEGRLSFVLSNPAQNGIGSWVRYLMAEDVSDWADLCIVRISLGVWNGTLFEPLKP